MFSGDFCKLTKTPSDGTSLGEPPGNFSDVGCCCCCFTSLEVFTFPGYFSLPQALHPGFLGQWGSPPALSSTLATSVSLLLPRFFVTVLPLVLRFWAGVFYPQALFTLHSFPAFWDVFVTQMRAGTPHPGSSFVPALTKLSHLADAWALTTWTTNCASDPRPIESLNYLICFNKPMIVQGHMERL